MGNSLWPGFSHQRESSSIVVESHGQCDLAKSALVAAWGTGLRSKSGRRVWDEVVARPSWSSGWYQEGKSAVDISWVCWTIDEEWTWTQLEASNFTFMKFDVDYVSMELPWKWEVTRCLRKCLCRVRKKWCHTSPLDWSGLRETNIKLQKNPSPRAGYGGLGLTESCRSKSGPSLAPTVAGLWSSPGL